MAAKGTDPPIEEQLRNANMVMRVANQPLVHAFILKYAEQHAGIRNGASSPGDESTRVEVRDAVLPITFTESVMKILPDLPNEFTYEDVINSLIEDRYEFRANDRRTAVGRVLHKLLDQGLIAEVKKGKGGSPSVYKRL